jgi:integral membrane sensor domain MASE1
MMVRDTVRALVLAVLAAAAYFVSARLGYAFAIPHGFVTLWPPSGLMLGLLVSSIGRHP